MRKPLAILMLLSVCIMAKAQKSVQLKTQFVQSQFDINWKIPTGFSAEEWAKPYYFYSTTALSKNKVAAANMYDLGATSDNKNCRLLYASLTELATVFQGHIESVYHSFAAHELYTAINNGHYIHQKEELTAEQAQQIKIYSGKQACEEYNADSVYVIDFPNVSDKMAPGYNHCIGIYLCKAGYFPIMVKCLLNDKGYQEKEKYIAITQKAVRFGTKGWSYNADKLRKENEKLQKALKK